MRLYLIWQNKEDKGGIMSNEKGMQLQMNLHPLLCAVAPAALPTIPSVWGKSVAFSYTNFPQVNSDGDSI